MGINVPVHVQNTPTGRIELFKRAAWLYACGTARSDAIKFIPLKLYKKEGKVSVEVLDHPIVDLLKEINPLRDTPSTIREATELSLYIHGAYPWKKVRNAVGVVKELYGLPMQDVKPIQRGTWIGELEYQFRDGRGARRVERYPMEDIVYFSKADPAGGFESICPLKVAVDVTDADIAITQTQNAMSKNAARPSAVMTVLNKLNDVDYARENERVQKQYAGAVNAGKIILIDNAMDTKFQTVQLSPSDMKWIEEHASHIKDICAVSRVPPGIAGDYGDASRIANAGAMHRFFAEIFAGPELEFVEENLNWQLLWKEDWGYGLGYEQKNGLYLKHDVSGVSMFREDETAASKRAQVVFTSGGTVDEARVMHGLEPKGGTEGATMLVPANLVPIAMAGQKVTSTPGKDTKPDTRPRTPPNASGGQDNPEPVSEAKSAEKKRYRKWRKRHSEGEFRFDFLNEDEQRALSIETQIESTLEKVEKALGE
jgi:HK97 family phage portal protein